MKLTKNKIIMISIAALCAIAVVVIVVMSLGALSVKSENTESISFAEGTFARFAKSKVTPCEASVKAIESNSVQLVKWYGVAMDAVSRGDMAFDGNVNEAAFKQKMIDEPEFLEEITAKVRERESFRNFPGATAVRSSRTVSRSGLTRTSEAGNFPKNRFCPFFSVNGRTLSFL